MAQVLVYANLDATMGSRSFEENAEMPPLAREAFTKIYGDYLPAGSDRRDPHVSPLWAENLGGLPPAIVVSAEFDPLRDENEAYARRLEEAGVPVVRRRYDGMIHGFFQMAGVLDGGREALEWTAAALRARFAG